MNDIDRIKELLFGNEKKALDAITRRLETPASRTADIADVLPESILRSHADKRLVAALQEPVEQVVRRSVRRNPADFADALFPVMGPAIRKAIAESLRAMMQSVNQAIENSLSLHTRYRAWRAGVPLGTYVLQKSIVYRVEQAFLIRRHDGLLIEHAQHDSLVTRDSDAVSAMFTAIQDFIRDSFSGGSTRESLSTAVLGDLTLWALEGPRAILVCVIRGVPPAGLRTELSEILERIHLHHDEGLAEFDGSRAIAGLEIELARCLELERRKDAAPRARRFPLAALVLLALLALLVGWWLFAKYQDARQLERLRTTLNATPGIVVTEVSRAAERIVVRGLRDPLSNAPADAAAGLHIDPTALQLELASYQSLDSAIVERRARRLLDPPAGVGLRLEGNRLTLTGTATVQWRQRAESLAFALPGVEVVDTSRMAVSESDVLAAARRVLEPPPEVELHFADGVLTATGSAPQRWLRSAVAKATAVPAVRSADLRAVAVTERVRLAELLAAVNDTPVFFSVRDELVAGQTGSLDRLVTRLRDLVRLADELDQSTRIEISGFADGTGTAATNRGIELARARRVAGFLIEAGLPADVIEVRAAGLVSLRPEIDPDLRRADVRVVVTPQ